MGELREQKRAGTASCCTLPPWEGVKPNTHIPIIYGHPTHHGPKHIHSGLPEQFTLVSPLAAVALTLLTVYFLALGLVARWVAYHAFCILFTSVRGFFVDSWRGGYHAVFPPLFVASLVMFFPLVARCVEETR